MIVKNEEKNIGKALGWAKSVAFEQIVVDTGSTDKTVEIAERMGAKVYRFEWVDDFSAAKNHAIEQATGNWIAFLDADEYFSVIDAKKLMIFLKRIQTDTEMREKYLALGCSLVNVDDNGNPVLVSEQVRVFRNIPSIRYTARIHERLDMDIDNMVWVDEIKIIHTGYAITERKEKGRTEYNIRMIRRELKENPEDLNLKVYLADSLKNTGNQECIAEAETLFTEIIDRGIGAPVTPMLKRIAYTYFMEKYARDPSKSIEMEELCRMGLDEYPRHIDFEYFLACALNNQGEYKEAWELLVSCEAALAEGSADLAAAAKITADPALLFPQMVLAAQGLGDVENVIKYVTIILKADKTLQGTLRPYIASLLKRGASTDELITLLKSIYDFSDHNDLLIIAQAAKDCGAIELARKILAIADES